MQPNEWQLVFAEIVSIKPSLLYSGYVSEGMHEVFAAKYVYGVDGKTYEGTMYVRDPDRVGEVFEIRYDPANPWNNTAPDQKLNVGSGRSLLRHALIYGVAILLVFLLKHFFPNLR